MADEMFSPGDEVQHKTGTAKMIYVGKDTLGDAICEWTDPSGRPQRESFSFVALKKYEAPPARASIKIGRA